MSWTQSLIESVSRPSTNAILLASIRSRASSAWSRCRTRRRCGRRTRGASGPAARRCRGRYCAGKISWLAVESTASIWLWTIERDHQPLAAVVGPTEPVLVGLEVGLLVERRPAAEAQLIVWVRAFGRVVQPRGGERAVVVARRPRGTSRRAAAGSGACSRVSCRHEPTSSTGPCMWPCSRSPNPAWAIGWQWMSAQPQTGGRNLGGRVSIIRTWSTSRRRGCFFADASMRRRTLATCAEEGLGALRATQVPGRLVEDVRPGGCATRTATKPVFVRRVERLQPYLLRGLCRHA